MKILFLTEFFPGNKELIFTGGVEAYNFFLARELAKKHKITIICRGNASDIKKIQGLKIIRANESKAVAEAKFSTLPSRFSYLIKAIKLGLKEDFDVVQGNNFVTYIPAFFIAFIRKKKAVAWYPDVFVGKWVKIAGILSGLIGEISERISLSLPWAQFIALSGSTKNKLIKVGISEKRITKIYAGVDLSFFKSIKIKKIKVFTVVCISRLVKYKRVDLLIKAAKILKDQKCIFKVSIIGEGPQKGDLFKLKQKLGLDQFVSIESGLSRKGLGKRLKESHLFCLPSEEEGFGLAVLEAAACGVPYLTSDLPVLKEVSGNGLGGEFFKKGNAADLARKITKFMRNKKLLRKKSVDAFSLAKSYTWEKIGEEFTMVYEKVLRKQTRILMLIDAWFPHIGGGQVHAWELSKNLIKLGCTVTIFTRNLGFWDKKAEGVKIIRVGFCKKFANLFGRIEYLLCSFFYCLIADYDILHAHAFSPGLIAPFVKFFRNKPTVYTVHGKGMKIAGLGFGENFLENLVTYKIPYDLAISVAKHTITKKVAAKRLVTISNGVNTETFKKAVRKRKIVKNILFVGRLSYEKGVDLLINAFKQLKNKQTKLTIVGNGKELSKLKKIASGINVEFKGKVVGKKLIEEYKKADLFILPSRTEGQPLTLFEAWASALPVIVTETGDNKLFVKHGINGLIAYPSEDSIYKTLSSVLNKNLNKIAENGLKTVQNFSWKKTAHTTYNEYRKILR